MIKLLAISGSPVTGSSTDILLRRVTDAVIAEVGNESRVRATFVKLNERRFVACQSCGEAPTPKLCFFDDDLTDIYTAVVECDCFLLGSPVYFDTVSAQAKTFIDRCNCFRPPDFKHVDPDHSFIRLLKGRRPGGMVLVGGERGWFEGARRVIAGFFEWIEVTTVGMVIYRSPSYARAGTVADDRSMLARADALGRTLARLILDDHD